MNIILHRLSSIIKKNDMTNAIGGRYNNFHDIALFIRLYYVAPESVLMNLP